MIRHGGEHGIREGWNPIAMIRKHRLAKPSHGSGRACPFHGSLSGAFAGSSASCTSDLRMMGVRWRARNQLKR